MGSNKEDTYLENLIGKELLLKLYSGRDGGLLGEIKERWIQECTYYPLGEFVDVEPSDKNQKFPLSGTDYVFNIKERLAYVSRAPYTFKGTAKEYDMHNNNVGDKETEVIVYMYEEPKRKPEETIFY